VSTFRERLLGRLDNGLRLVHCLPRAHWKPGKTEKEDACTDTCESMSPVRIRPHAAEGCTCKRSRTLWKSSAKGRWIFFHTFWSQPHRRSTTHACIAKRLPRPLLHPSPQPPLQATHHIISCCAFRHTPCISPHTIIICCPSGPSPAAFPHTHHSRHSQQRSRLT
jgi:hypothetical protein